MGVTKDRPRRLPRLEMSEDYRRALFELVEVGRESVVVHHIPDQSGTLPEPHAQGGDRGLLHQALQVLDALLGVGVDPVVDGLHAHGADSCWERAHASSR